MRGIASRRAKSKTGAGDADDSFIAPLRELCYTCILRGAVAQPGERFNGIEEVAGSSPASSTTNQSNTVLYSP